MTKRIHWLNIAVNPKVYKCILKYISLNLFEMQPFKPFSTIRVKLRVKTYTYVYKYKLYMCFIPLTSVCEGPGSIYEDHVGRQQHDADPVGQSDQTTAPLGPPLGEAAAEQQVETQPANQAAGHRQHRHGVLRGNEELTC